MQLSFSWSHNELLANILGGKREQASRWLQLSFTGFLACGTKEQLFLCTGHRITPCSPPSAIWGNCLSSAKERVDKVIHLFAFVYFLTSHRCQVPSVAKSSQGLPFPASTTAGKGSRREDRMSGSGLAVSTSHCWTVENKSSDGNEIPLKEGKKPGTWREEGQAGNTLKSKNQTVSGKWMEQLEGHKPKERIELWRRWHTKNEINVCTQTGFQLSHCICYL